MVTDYKIKNIADFNKKLTVYDIEVYPNYFLVVFLSEAGIEVFTAAELGSLKSFIDDPELVLIGYNNLSYDDIILKAIYKGYYKTAEEIYNLSQEIITRSNDDMFNRLKWRTKQPWYRSIDLMQLAFKDDDMAGGKASLKEIAVRLKCEKIQDLPYDFNKELTEDEMEHVKTYCMNDIQITAELWNRLHKAIELRLQLEQLYNVDVITASEAQCAEAIMKELYIRHSGIRPEQLRALRTDHKEINIADCIAASIQFKTAALEDLLNEWKAMKLSFFNEVLQDKTLKREITLKNKAYSLGSGGIHSIDDPAVYSTTEDRIIYDVDVTSYYPSIILNMNLHPGHLTSVWTDILKELTTERIAAKKAGEKLKADSLKIVINSAYGKTGNQYSFMCDPKLMLTVTITGQLSLLMLIEQLSEADIEVLSANTDGITASVKVQDVAAFTSICNTWQENTGFNLEKTVYKKYIRRDINNYIAEPVDGYIKKKGIFDDWNLYKKNDCKIISKALENYFLKNIPVEETISLDNKEADIHDYLQSYKAAKGFIVYIGEQPQQRTNRWYVSTEGYTLEKRKDGKTIKVENARSVKVVNEIIDTGLPADLDLQFYRQEAKEIILKMENSAKAEWLKVLGLFPLPKEYKYNPSGSKLNEIKTDWNFSKKAGIGVYTGSAAALIAIDIDHPAACSTSKACNLFSDTMIVTHGTAAPAEVLKGKVKGTLLYKAVDLDTCTTDKKFVDQHGFEVIYGGKTVQVLGLHPDGTDYKLSGELKELPAELRTWIEENTKKKKRNRKKASKEADLFGDHPGTCPDAQQEDQSEKQVDLLKKIISDDPELHRWKYREVEGNFIKLQGSCPYEHIHGDKGGSTDSQFDIIITDNNTLYAGCFHQSCKDEVKRLNYRLNEKWLEYYPKEKVNLKTILSSLFSGSEQAAEFRQISEAFKQPGRVKLIAAPTGSGKTYSSVSYFLQKVAAGEHIIYCTSNKTSMAEFIETIEERTGQQLKDLRIQQLRSGYAMDENTDDETDMENQEAAADIKDKTLGVITHHTYFSRKGISDLFYSVLTWIDKYKAIVIIDEIDSYIQAQSKLIPVESRYRKLKPKGSEVAYYYRRNKCPSFRGKHNCSSCHLGSLPKYEVNTYHIPTFYHIPKIEENNFALNLMELPDIKCKNKVFIEERGLYIEQVEQHKDLLKNKVYKFHMKDNELFNFKTAISDMIETAYNPVLYSYHPVIDGQAVSAEYLEGLSDEDKVKIRYPYMPCMVHYLSVTDIAVPYYLNRAAKEIILLSATVSQSNKNYLKTCFEDLQEINIIESTQKIDELMIIGYGKEFKYLKQDNVLIENLQEFGKVLIFEPNKSEASSLYKKFPQNFPVAHFKQDDIEVNEKFSECWKYMISHSRGNIGRAINLPQFYTCFIDSSIYKPSNSYNLQEMTIEEIIRLQQDDRITTTIQNAGRILRGSGRKIIAISHITNEEIDFIADRFKVMVNSEIKTAYYSEDHNVLLKTIGDYHRTGELIIYPEEKKIDKALVSDLSKVSPKQRTEVKEEYDQVKQEKKIAGKIRIARALQEEGYSWSRIYREVNLSRMSKEDQEVIKEAIENSNIS